LRRLLYHAGYILAMQKLTVADSCPYSPSPAERCVSSLMPVLVDTKVLGCAPEETNFLRLLVTSIMLVSLYCTNYDEHV
jgi:hypothetical protein